MHPPCGELVGGLPKGQAFVPGQSKPPPENLPVREVHRGLGLSGTEMLVNLEAKCTQVTNEW